MPGHPRVFVIQDGDPSIRDALEALLNSAGLAVEAFESAKAFLHRPLPDGPCCLMLDVRLPELDSLAIQGRLAQAAAAIPIVFFCPDTAITSAAMPARQGGVYAPVTLEDSQVLDAVTRALVQADEAWRRRREQGDDAARLARLTARERQVAELVAQGRLNKQIAYELGISEETVKVHRGRVNRKLEVDSVAALVRLFDRQIS